MNLLKELLDEEAAVGATAAGSVAGFRGSLFGGKEETPDPDNEQKRKKKKKKLKTTMLTRMLTTEADDEAAFDITDVMSKLKASEKSVEVSRDSVQFGLEDEDGRIIKVYVRAEQAGDFETALGQALDQMENSTTEIAEVLFGLREKFDIINVEWPAVQEDEEEEIDLKGDTNPEDDAEGEMDADVEVDGEVGVDSGVGVDSEADAKTALQSVIDMMKADADARKAEANAKKAAADADSSKYAAQSAEAKIKGEEEVLDMETYNAEKAKKQKEAKALSSLARYRHEKARDAGEELDAGDETIGTTVSGSEEEEYDLTDDAGMDSEKYLAYVIKHLKVQA